jgi:hypothetical protein
MVLNLRFAGEFLAKKLLGEAGPKQSHAVEQVLTGSPDRCAAWDGLPGISQRFARR